MLEKRTIKKAQADKKKGKSPSSQASHFVEEEIKHIRQGKHGAKYAREAIGIGLSKAAVKRLKKSQAAPSLTGPSQLRRRRLQRKEGRFSERNLVESSEDQKKTTK